MKLYFSPGACSLSPHIALREAGLDFEIEKVTLSTKKTATDADFRAINPKGHVPALVLDGGEVLTEGPAIVQYIADRKPEAKLAPAAGTLERYRLQEWLNYISTELHKQYSPLFNPKTPDETKQASRAAFAPRFELLTKHLEGRSFLLGDTFSVADGYLYTVLRWSRLVGVDLSGFPVLLAFMERVEARPAVRAALEAEGLLKNEKK